MAKRKWIFGSLCVAIGITIGQMIPRAGDSTARSADSASAGIPLAISAPPPPVQESANLKITDVNFCHKIANFGNYETYPRDEFEAGQEVLIYAEIEDLHSDRLPDGKYQTRVKSTIEVFQECEPRNLMERSELPETVDVCRRRRLDYFHSYQFTIPGMLTAGDYVLRLTVEDQLDQRQGSGDVKFSVK
jgi:hypothetical protein